eukprot:scaffold193_cov139-Amphora_coffeaeformis.AAC.8
MFDAQGFMVWCGCCRRNTEIRVETFSTKPKLVNTLLGLGEKEAGITINQGSLLKGSINGETATGVQHLIGDGTGTKLTCRTIDAHRKVFTDLSSS